MLIVVHAMSLCACRVELFAILEVDLEEEGPIVSPRVGMKP